MAATPLPVAKRFFQPGVSKVYYVPTSANYKAMTMAELDAGTDLTSELSDAAGWNATSNNVDAPDFDSKFTSKVSGLITADDSSLTFYGSSDGTDVRTVLPRDTVGYIVWMDGGRSGTGNKMDVYPVTVSSLSKQRTNSDVFKIMVNFAITQEPAENLAIPTV